MDDGRARYVLRLYVAGGTSRSLRAVENLRRICDEHLPADYDLEVIDIYRQLGRAREEEIVAVPTLVKALPLPVRRLIGDMSDTTRVLHGLDVRAQRRLA